MSTPCYYCELDQDSCKFCIHEVDIVDLLKQAHREGWEQAKAEAVKLANTLDKWGDWESDQPDFVLIADAIAAMEYGGKND